MNAARIDKSDRLRRVLAALKKAKKPLTTRDIQERAQVCEKATRLPSSVLREVVERLEAKEAGK